MRPDAIRDVRVDAALAGERLDRALMRLGDLSLRAARRLIEDGGVRVDGRTATAALRLRPGQRIEAAAPAADPPRPAGVRLLAREGDFAAFFKPAGLHSSPLAGRGGGSLEEAAQALWAAAFPAEPARLRFLQRLDCATSGLVCAALTDAARQRFRVAEAAGQCRKDYLALLCGELDTPRLADRALDVRNRRVSRVLDRQADPLRHTRLAPLAVWRGAQAAALLAACGLPPAHGPVTLACCTIRCGARHQIRAHAAALGLPLCGDERYAHPQDNPPNPARERFFLHHACLTTPFGRWICPPEWPALPPQENRLQKWLESLGRSASMDAKESLVAARSRDRDRV